MNVGAYVYARDAVRISGSVEEVFLPEWEPHPATGSRTLTKLPPTQDSAEVLCAVRLTRPINLLSGYDTLPSGFVPVIEDGDDPLTDLVYGPADSLATMPDGL